MQPMQTDFQIGGFDMDDADGKSDSSYYRKGRLKLVDHGLGRVTLQEAGMDDAHQNVRNVELDTSGLSLAGEGPAASNNPYDSAPEDQAAKIWNPGRIR